MSDSGLQIDVRKRFADFDLEVKLDLPLTGVTSVFGPSGAGKSTLLRLIAGFERPDHGTIRLGADLFCDAGSGLFVPPHRRKVGYVFQDANLFPHLTVAGNLAYGERRAGARSERVRREDVIDGLGLAPLLERKPQTLSGGERQRVAIGRALLTGPDLLLFDEPLSALDQERKSGILPLLADMPARFGIPALHVSHDISEVARIADRVILLDQGKVRDDGPVAPVLTRHGLEPGRVPGGYSVVLEGILAGHEPDFDLTLVRIDDTLVRLPFTHSRPLGTKVRLRVEARDVALSLDPPEGLSIRNALPGRIADVQPDPGTAFAHVRVRLKDQDIMAQVTRAAIADLMLEPGLPVFVLVKSASLSG